jgi:hypothetical protein
VILTLRVLLKKNSRRVRPLDMKRAARVQNVKITTAGLLSLTSPAMGREKKRKRKRRRSEI